MPPFGPAEKRAPRRGGPAPDPDGGAYSLPTADQALRYGGQPGDLSCGGHAPRGYRRCIPLASLFRRHAVIQGRPRELSRLRGPLEYRLICLFLANALRETWEELGLNPMRIRFLGPLPTYSLILFRRTIFPLMAW